MSHGVLEIWRLLHSMTRKQSKLLLKSFLLRTSYPVLLIGKSLVSIKEKSFLNVEKQNYLEESTLSVKELLSLKTTKVFQDTMVLLSIWIFGSLTHLILMILFRLLLMDKSTSTSDLIGITMKQQITFAVLQVGLKRLSQSVSLFPIEDPLLTYRSEELSMKIEITNLSE
jgi:hypothetical protein